jgi:chromate transporter
VLFRAFLMLGLSGFGGVLPLARRMLVDRRGWLTEAAFTDLLGLCQFLPGGNVINLSLAVGLRFAGIPGAAAAITGLLAAPAVIVILAGALYDRFAANPQLRHLFAGIAAAAAGLLIGLAWRLITPLWPQLRPLALAAATALAIGLFRQPLLPTLLVMLPLSIWLMRPAP